MPAIQVLDISGTDPSVALRDVNLALRAYERASRRPRPAHGWNCIVSMLWQGRADALRSGLFASGSEAYRFVSDRLTDAHARFCEARRSGRTRNA